MSVLEPLGDNLPAVPAGARRLGTKVKPTLRLGMGYKDPARGFPIKTDHFTVRGDNERALQKFIHVYTDTPKVVDIMLRPELRESLDIRYRAFGGGQHEGGGMIKAVGHTNFALLDYMGGPDTLTVWTPDGSVEEIDITGKDDLRAIELGVELAMTFRFGLPKVLSYGAVAEISSRGSESIDTVWAKLREWHALAHWLNAPVSRVTGQPMLVLKASSMMAPKIEKRGQVKVQVGWQKSPVYVLDLVLQETQDEMVARVTAEREKVLAAGGARGMLYGVGSDGAELRAQLVSTSAALAEPDFGEPDDGDPGPDEDAVVHEGEVVAKEPAATAAPEPPPEPVRSPYRAPASAGVDETIVAAAEAASTALYPAGTSKGKTLAEVAASDPKSIGWLLGNWKTEPLRTQVRAFARIYAPEQFQAALAAEEVAS